LQSWLCSQRYEEGRLLEYTPYARALLNHDIHSYQKGVGMDQQGDTGLGTLIGLLQAQCVLQILPVATNPV
jgi:hypothetical protein